MGNTATLTSTEVSLLRYLATHSGRDIAHDELMREVWQAAPQISTRAQHTAVSRLRKKIEAKPKEPRHLLNVHGVGYRFVAWAAPSRVPLCSEQPMVDLVGREGLLHMVRNLLHPGRPLTLVGVGGVGKTQVALAMGAEHSNPVAFFDLSEAVSEHDVLAVVGRHLGTQGETPLDEALSRSLTSQKVGVVVFDSCEQIRAGALSTMIRLVGDLPLVFTSRSPLGLPNEQLVEVDPLCVADATKLFARCAGRARVGFFCDPKEAAPVLRLLGGLPLAIELAAARLRVASLPQLIQSLRDEGLSVLRARRSAVPRHQSMRACFDWSWGLLDDESRRAATILGAATGPVSRDMPAVAGIWEQLEDLADHGLIHLQGKQIDVLPPVQAFFAEKLNDELCWGSEDVLDDGATLDDLI